MADREPTSSTKRLPADTAQLTVYVPSELANAARNAVVATAAHKRGYQTLSALVADALAEKLGRLEKQFNSGKAFPQRTAPVRRGAPMK